MAIRNIKLAVSCSEWASAQFGVSPIQRDLLRLCVKFAQQWRDAMKDIADTVEVSAAVSAKAPQPTPAPPPQPTPTSHGPRVRTPGHGCVLGSGSVRAPPCTCLRACVVLHR